MTNNIEKHLAHILDRLLNELKRVIPRIYEYCFH